MQPPRAQALAVLGAALFLCCGTDEVLEPHPSTPIETGGRNTAGSAGSVAGGDGSVGGDETAGTANPGAGHGPGGAPNGAEGGAPPTVHGGAGGETQQSSGEQLGFCSRLTMRPTRSSNVALLYEQAVYDDCRIKWVTDLYLVPKVRADFLNDLIVWNLELWGCQGEPVQSFALIYGEAPLSAGDAALLIEYYLDAALEELDMSEPELDEMKAALERLSEPLIDDPSTEPSQPRCDTGAAGAGGAENEAGAGGLGGAAGAPQGTAGQGGLP